MPPAARLLDTTLHGSPLIGPRFSKNVFIGKLPAWRVGDKSICPLITPALTPHEGGRAVGASTVFINKKPAARVGDIIPEKSPVPNMITKGCLRVRIG